MMVFGAYVSGGGHARIDDVRLTQVPKSTPLSNRMWGVETELWGGLPLEHVRPLAAPTNLDFEATEPMGSR